MITNLLSELPISRDDPRPYGGINIFSPAVKQQSTDLLELCKKYGQIFPEQSVLDFGCGTGRVLANLSKVTRHAVGVDVCDRYLQYCRQYGLKTYHVDWFHPEFNPKAKETNPKELPFKDGVYDRVVGIALLNHQSPTKAREILAEALRVTKRGGILLFTCFLLNAQSKMQLQLNGCNIDFIEKTPEWWVVNQSRPYLNGALDEEMIRRHVVENKGQIIEPIHYGQWRNINHAPTGHDLIAIRKL